MSPFSLRDTHDDGQSAAALEVLEDHQKHFRTFFVHTDFAQVFSPASFNENADPTILGRQLMQMYREGFAEHTGYEWSDY